MSLPTSTEQRGLITRPPLLMQTFEGTARSGKGTTVRATSEAFKKRGERVHVIDQGQKYRSLALLATRLSVDFTSQRHIDDFLQSDRTADEMSEVLADISTLSDAARDELLYTDDMSHRAGRIGANDHSHGLAVDLMHTEIEDAHQDGIEIVLVDGRTLEQHVRSTSPRIGTLILSAHFSCDSLVAARRVEKLFGPVSSMAIDERLRLLSTAEQISSRNASDMARAIDPLRRPTRALNFTYEKYESGDADKVIKKSLEVDPRNLRLSVDTTRTASIEHMTGPLVEIALATVDEWRDKA